MSEQTKFSLKNKFKNWLDNSKFLQKIKKIKHLEIVIAVIFIAILLLVYFGNFSNSKENSSTSSIAYTSGMDYATAMENKLQTILSSIKGAGKVQVLISVKSGSEVVIATSTEEKRNTSTNSSGSTEAVTVVTNPIIVTQNGTSKPLVLMEILPEIQGVIVVAEGANDVKVKLNLLNAIQALLTVQNSNIQIFCS